MKNIPNIWGVKKAWLPLIDDVEEKPKPKPTINERGEMLCPLCGEYVKRFRGIARGFTRLMGSVNSHGDFNYDVFDDDYDYDMLEITCPDCGEEVFDSNEDRLKKYYHPR